MTALSNAHRAPPMGKHAARGIFWMLVQTLSSKAAGILAQLILGNLLTDVSFGMANAAFTIVAFTSYLPRLFLVEILVQRQHQFRRYANAAFWLALVSAILSTALICTVAPLAGMYKHNMTISWLMMIFSINFLLDPLCVTPVARMQIDLRFKALGFVGTTSNLILAVSTVVFALLGFGPYALVLPRPIMCIYQVIIYWYLSPVAIKRTPQVRLWKRLFPSGAVLTASAYFSGILLNGDNFALYLFHTAAVLGIYAFAYNLSTQTLQMLATNLTPTLFSVLAKLRNEVPRQVDAYLRAARTLNLIIIFLCVLQGAVAAPTLQLLYGHKWDRAIPVLQILSLAMAFAGTAGGTNALIQAQGRFRFQFIYQMCLAVVFMGLVLIAALSGGEVAVAMGVLLFAVTMHPLSVYLAARPARVPLRQVLGLYAMPLTCAVIACSVPWIVLLGLNFLADPLLPVVAWLRVPYRTVEFLQCLAIAGLAAPLYMLLMRTMWRAQYETLLTHAAPVLAKLRIG